MITFLGPKIVPKGWGREVIFASNDLYAGKLLEFRKGSKGSMHFHLDKTETFYLLSGTIELHGFDLQKGDKMVRVMLPGDIAHIPPGTPHQIISLEGAIVIEASTADRAIDNYRIGKGDSQT